MNKQMENIMKYSDDHNAKIILKNEKIFNVMYTITFIIMSALYIFFAIKSTLKITILYIIMAIIMILYKKFRFNKLLKKYMLEKICIEGVLNVSIYYAKKIINTNKSYNQSMNNIAFAFIELGEFEKAENVLQHLEDRNLSNIEKCSVMKNKMRMLFLKNDIEGFKNEKKELIKNIESMPDKYKKQIMLSIDLQEATLDADYDTIDKLATTCEKNANLYNRINLAYYRGYVLEKKSDQEYENYYKFIAENGKNLFIANMVRDKLNIDNKFQDQKLKSHLGFKIILFIITSILIALIFSIYDCNYEESNIKWDTGKVQLSNYEIVLPCAIEEFEEITGIDIDEDEINDGFYKLIPGEKCNGISLCIENNKIEGIEIDISNYYNDYLDQELGKMLLFPCGVNTYVTLEQSRKAYNTGALEFFRRESNEQIDVDKYASYIKYSGNNYDVSIKAMNQSIQSIFYYYKH